MTRHLNKVPFLSFPYLSFPFLSFPFLIVLSTIFQWATLLPVSPILIQELVQFSLSFFSRRCFNEWWSNQQDTTSNVSFQFLVPCSPLQNLSVWVLCFANLISKRVFNDEITTFKRLRSWRLERKYVFRPSKRANLRCENLREIPWRYSFRNARN